MDPPEFAVSAGEVSLQRKSQKHIEDFCVCSTIFMFTQK